MKSILSFDASTTTIGISVINYEPMVSFNKANPKLIYHDFFKPPKDGDIFERLAVVRNFVFEKLEKYNPDDVALEDIILFMKGHSTAKTVSSLAVLNRTVGLAIFNHAGHSPHLLNVMKIRHALKKDKELPPKETIPELVAEHLSIEFPWRFNKKEKVIVENYDVADAIAVGLAFIKLNAVEKPPEKRLKGRGKQ